MSKLDNLTDADLEKMLPNARALEYAERLAERLIVGEGKCPVSFARELIRLIHEVKPSLWQRIKRALQRAFSSR